MLQEDPVYPSKKLVEHYKEKLREWRGKYLDLLRDVEACKELAKKSSMKEDEAVKILNETGELQELLSELRQCLYRERDQVLLLTRENDQLELQKLEDRKKIDFLLDAAGLKEEDLTLDERGRKAASFHARKRVRFREVTNFNKSVQKFREDSLVEKLQLRVNALEAQLQEQTEHLRDELVTLTDDFALRKSEWEVQRKRLMQQISCLSCRLKNAQLFKFQEMISYLEQLDEDRERDIKLIEENDRLKRSLAICRELLGPDFPDEKKKNKQEFGLRLLREQIEQRDKLIEGYLEQNSALCEQVRALKAEVEAEKGSRLKERERLLGREDYFKKRMDEEKRRRQLEAEGFMSDVRLLRSKLQSLERQVKHEQRLNRHPKES